MNLRYAARFQCFAKVFPFLPARGIEGPARFSPQRFREAGVLFGEHSDHEVSVMRKPRGGRADQLAQPVRSYHGILVPAQEILERHEIAQSALGRLPIDVGEKLDRVAQFLSANARLMEFLRGRGCRQLLAFLDQFAMALENEIRCRQKHRKPSRRRSRAGSSTERLGRALDEPLDAPRCEELQHAPVRALAFLAEAPDQGIQCGAIARIDRRAPFSELRQLHVQIAHLSGCAHPRAQRNRERRDPRRQEIAKDAQRGAHSPEPHTKVVQRFGISPPTRRGLVLPRLDKVPAQHAHTQLSDGERAIQGNGAKVELWLDGDPCCAQEIDLRKHGGRRHGARGAHRLEEGGQVQVAGFESAGLDGMENDRLHFRGANDPLLDRESSQRFSVIDKKEGGELRPGLQDRLKRMVSQNCAQSVAVRRRKGARRLGPGLRDQESAEPGITLLGKPDRPELGFPRTRPGGQEEPGPAKAGILAVPKDFAGLEGGLVPDLQLQPAGVLLQPTPKEVTVCDPVAAMNHDIRKIPPGGLRYTLGAR